MQAVYCGTGMCKGIRNVTTQRTFENTWSLIAVYTEEWQFTIKLQHLASKRRGSVFVKDAKWREVRVAE